MVQPQELNRIRWRTLHYPDLLREAWEDEWFLFNPPSGNTHVLNGLAMDILDRIHRQSAGLPELSRALIEEYRPEEPARFTARPAQPPGNAPSLVATSGLFPDRHRNALRALPPEAGIPIVRMGGELVHRQAVPSIPHAAARQGLQKHCPHHQ